MSSNKEKSNVINWNITKIAYAPYHKKLKGPGDRRRFVFYAKERNVEFDLANPLKLYDIVYLTYGCNLSLWMEYKKRNPQVKFIFELIDSYLFEKISFFTIFRGAYWYLIGREKYLWINYKNALREMIRISDAVVCSTQAQKNEMLKFNNNVHISLDYFTDDINNNKKNVYENSRPLKLVWEGQANTVKNIFLINDVLEKLKDKVELIIITDPINKKKYNYFEKDIEIVLRKLKCKYNFIHWNIGSFAKIISNADLAIIPIYKDNSMMWNKPENKLLLFWEIGIPVLTSGTPNYKQVMQAANLDYYCENSIEWQIKIQNFIENSTESKIELLKKINSFKKNNYNKEKLLENWEKIFLSINLKI